MAIDKIINVKNVDKLSGATDFDSVTNIKRFISEIPASVPVLGDLAVLSEIDKASTIVLSNGNLTYNNPSSYGGVLSTGVYSTGKKEFWIFNDNSNRMMAGIAMYAHNVNSYPANDSRAVAVWADNGRVYKGGGTAQFLGTIADQTWFGIRHDADTGEIWFKIEGGSWVKSDSNIDTGEWYYGLVGTGTSGANDPSNVVFNPSNFPETIGAGFGAIREPVIGDYTRFESEERINNSFLLGPNWRNYSWTSASDATMISRDGYSTGKYEFWVQKSTSSIADGAMVGIGNPLHPLSTYPGGSSYGVGLWFSAGNAWSNGSSITGNIGNIVNGEYLGVRFDIDLQTIEFNNNGAGWTAFTGEHINVWSGDVHAIVGRTSGGLGTNDFMKVLFDPNDFPQAISSGYNPLTAS